MYPHHLKFKHTMFQSEACRSIRVFSGISEGGPQIRFTLLICLEEKFKVFLTNYIYSVKSSTEKLPIQRDVTEGGLKHSLLFLSISSFVLTMSPFIYSPRLNHGCASSPSLLIPYVWAMCHLIYCPSVRVRLLLNFPHKCRVFQLCSAGYVSFICKVYGVARFPVAGVDTYNMLKGKIPSVKTAHETLLLVRLDIMITIWPKMRALSLSECSGNIFIIDCLKGSSVFEPPKLSHNSAVSCLTIPPVVSSVCNDHGDSRSPNDSIYNSLLSKFPRKTNYLIFNRFTMPANKRNRDPWVRPYDPFREAQTPTSSMTWERRINKTSLRASNPSSVFKIPKTVRQEPGTVMPNPPYEALTLTYAESRKSKSRASPGDKRCASTGGVNGTEAKKAHLRWLHEKAIPDMDGKS